MTNGRLVGNNNKTWGTAIPSNYVYYQKFTATRSGSMIKFVVYSQSGSATVKVAIYSHDAVNDRPSSRLAVVATATAITNGINYITISAVDIVADTVYWLGIISDLSSNVQRNDTGGTSVVKSATFSSFSFPETYSNTGFTAGTRDVAIAGWGLVPGIIDHSMETELHSGIEEGKIAVRIPYQRKVFTAAGRVWAFYTRDGDMYMSSSADSGENWATPTLIISEVRSFEFASWWDGSYVHAIYAKLTIIGDGDLFYRRGTPGSDGTITWDAAWAAVFSPASGHMCGDPMIVANSSGYPFIVFGDVTNSSSDTTVKVLKSSTNNGTFTVESNTSMCSSTGLFSMGCLVPLSSGRVYCVYAIMHGGSNVLIYGKLWDEGWGSEETASTSYLDQTFYDMFNTVAVGDDVYLIFLKQTTFDILVVKRTYGSGWGAETTLTSGTTGNTAPVLSASASNLFAFWIASNIIKIKKCIGGTWDASATDIVDETVDTIGTESCINVSALASGKVDILYVTQAYTPFNIKYESYLIQSGSLIPSRNRILQTLIGR